MVWGMPFPKEFGASRPRGELVGWDDQLTQEFNKLPPDQRSTFRYAARFMYYISECLVIPPGRFIGLEYPLTRPVTTKDAPTRYQISGRYQFLSSLFVLPNGILVVDGELKALFESFERGVHQFFPIKLMTRAGEFDPKEYFVLAVGQWLDSFSPTASNPSAWRENGSEHYFIITERKYMSKLAFSRKEFGGAHLWRERRISRDFLCFSDALASAVKESGLRLPKYFRMQEI